ncbi:MAG: metal ABC transporter permease [Candidatus Dormibacteraeota bacterium]|nr:metal ABC transporter permease [Candidatus Dormibacteraeota bacterium]MBO0760331.1 metal ABC transporter permease [Candidatus Dormibacteraeota bacterium]
MGEPQPSFDVIADVQQLLQYHFMQNALLAGTLVAAVAGVVGYFVVLRGQTFAAHTLSQVGFPGAAGAALLGLPQLAGLLALCIASSLGIAGLGRSDGSRAGEPAAIGAVQAFALALGFLFVGLYKGFLTGINGLLFGTFLGVSDGQVVQLAVVAVVSLGVLVAIGRPLLLLSIDPDLAAARRVPVRTLSLLFLVFLGLSVASVTLVTGALLVFSLLVTPAAAAQELTARPPLAILLGVVLAVVVTWLSLSVAYFTVFPIGFFVTTFGFATYLLARGVRWAREDRAR